MKSMMLFMAVCLCSCTSKSSLQEGINLPNTQSIVDLFMLDNKNDTNIDAIGLEGYFTSLVVKYQRKYIRQSYGVYAYECFTNADLNYFIANKIVEQIQEELRKDKKFLTNLSAFHKLSESEQNRIREKMLSTFQPTWKEYGKISENAQTLAGQKAQKRVNKGIVALLRE